MHKWKVQRFNLKLELLAFTVKGRLGSSTTGVGLAYDAEVNFEIACRVVNIESFLQHRDPLFVFVAIIENIAAEEIGRLQYDQYGEWAIALRDIIRNRLQHSERDHSERNVGIRVEGIYITSFLANKTHGIEALYKGVHGRNGSQTDFEQAEEVFSRAAESYIPDDLSTISIRIVEEPLTAQNFSNIIGAFSELYTKCWLIANDQFAELIEYMQTHNSRFDERANLVIAKLTHNSPAEIKFSADISPRGVIEALKIAIDAIAQAPLRHREAILANQAKALEIKTKEEEARSVLTDKEQARSIESQKAELAKQKGLLEIQKKQLEIERERLNLQKEYLELENLRIKFAIENANEMIDTLNPGTDARTREILLQTLLPNLLQLVQSHQRS